MVQLTGRLAGGIPSAGGRGRPRLTRRGRLVVIAISMLALFLFFSLGRVSTQAATSTPKPVQLREAVITPGESLWQLAERIEPQADPRATVQMLMDLNHLRSPAVVPGELVLLPLRA